VGAPERPRKQESLDEIVSHSAVVLADQIQKAAAWAKSEMDLQVEVASALKDFARRAQIKLEGHHNITVATGRPDSVYGSVIVEYKDPGTLSPIRDAAPNQKVIEQLKRRFYDMNREERRNWNSMFGVGTDGRYFVFLRFRLDKWSEEDPAPVDRDSTRRFLWALYNLGQKGLPYQPEYLHGDFGSESAVARTGVLALYDEVSITKEPKAQIFFNQWKILFGEVCGYDVENTSEKLDKLAEAYVVKGRARPAQLLFAVHTYYALLLKLISLEIVYFYQFRNMPRHFERLIEAGTSQKLRKVLEELEFRGGLFHQLGITNFLERDLFSWYLSVWSEPVETLVRRMLEKLDQYNPGTISEDPSQSRDLLKKLYQQLFPKSVRHDLGEYYTPDWLAEHVLDELGYEGDPEKRILDPACGSGTFLVMAINRIRRWYDKNREKCSYDEGGLLQMIQKNVVGFDLNPPGSDGRAYKLLACCSGLASKGWTSRYPDLSLRFDFDT
jgi:N-6 DNA Methylase